MKTILLISAIFLFSDLAYGQESLVFKGQVTDVNTRKPLADCHVYVSCKEYGTITDENGKFTLEVPLCYMTHCLVVSHIGYEKYIYPIHDISGADIAVDLAEGPITMAELVFSPDHYWVIHRPEFESYSPDQIKLSKSDQNTDPAETKRITLEARLLNIHR